MSAIIQTLLAQVNISILPVILLPVTGLSCLVFYNRLAALNGLIHTIQREIRGGLIHEKPQSKKEKQVIETLYTEYQMLIKRSHVIRRAIRCCFIALFLFALSALTVIVGAFWINAVFVTLFLWAFGAISFAIAIINGFIEMYQPALHSLRFETQLIEEWMSVV